MRFTGLLYIFFIFSTAKAADFSDLETIGELKDEYRQALDKQYALLPHKGNYIIPVSYNDNPNNSIYEDATFNDLRDERGDFVDPVEAEFQFSFLVLTNKNIFGTSFNAFVGYTQNTWWQVYNSSWSRQFRESNYAPEIFARKILNDPARVVPTYGDSSLLPETYIVGFDFGYIHESNGQIQEISRSWDRLFIRGLFFSGPLVLTATLWHRISESRFEDQNPNIIDYGGLAEIETQYFIGEKQIHLKLRPGLSKWGGELSYKHPWKESLNFYIKANYGYGQSLQDYDHETQRIGIGFIVGDIYQDILSEN